jgi:hypothetical protein
MKQWTVNSIRLFLRISCVISLISFVNGCTTISPQLPTGWRIARSIEDVTPQSQIALWMLGNSATLAWAGSPHLPNLQFALEEKPPLQLALGITPRLLTSTPLANNWTQLLWLDQTMPGDMHLIGGTVDANGELQRGPTAISNVTTVDYAAAPTPSGAMVVLWSTPARAGLAANTELYLQLIDSVGRPLPEQRITATGQFPALSYDLRGDLHLVWLSTTDGKQWTIHHSLLAASLDLTQAAVNDLPSSVIGAVSLSPAQSIDAISVTADADSLYAVWSISTAGGSTSAQGVTFPLDQPSAIRPFTITLDGYQLRWPSLATTPNNEQHIALIALNTAGQSMPVLGKLTHAGIADLQPMSALGSIVSYPSLAISGNGNLHLAWLRMENEGQSTLMYITNAP